MDLASVCISRQVIKSCRLEEELVERWNRCLQSEPMCTPPNTNAIDFDTLWDDLRYRTRLSEQWYPDD
jgi:hypothetical protein